MAPTGLRRELYARESVVSRLGCLLPGMKHSCPFRWSAHPHVSSQQIFILNRSRLSNATTLASSLTSTITGLARSTNTLSNSLLNVSAHYDISNAMFAAFLSDAMTYSCPILLPKSDPRSSDETLEQAQETELQHFITNARIKSTDHVLEIGTGWGSFAIAAVRRTGCSVTSVTLSKEQKSREAHCGRGIRG